MAQKVSLRDAVYADLKGFEGSSFSDKVANLISEVRILRSQQSAPITIQTSAQSSPITTQPDAATPSVMSQEDKADNLLDNIL